MPTGYLLERHRQTGISGLCRGASRLLLYPGICVLLQHCDRFPSCLALESSSVTMNNKNNYMTCIKPCVGRVVLAITFNYLMWKIILTV